MLELTRGRACYLLLLKGPALPLAEASWGDLELSSALFLFTMFTLRKLACFISCNSVGWLGYMDSYMDFGALLDFPPLTLFVTDSWSSAFSLNPEIHAWDSA